MPRGRTAGGGRPRCRAQTLDPVRGVEKRRRPAGGLRARGDPVEPRVVTTDLEDGGDVEVLAGVPAGELDPAVLGGRSRPDLVGQDDEGAWHAFECKGRSSVPNAEDQRKAKTQAQRLVRVGSTACSLHVGAVSYFRQPVLEFHWRDPDPEDTEKLTPIEVSLPEDAWCYYYAPALACATGRLADGRENTDIKVEVHKTVLELLLAGKWAAAQLRARELGGALEEDGFRADGLRGWSLESRGGGGRATQRVDR